jgi:hypothetical protein
MKNKIKPFFRSINCFHSGGKKVRKAKKQRVSTFNVICVTLLASQTAAPAKAARRSIFVGVHQEASSEAALCQSPDDDDVSLDVSGAPTNVADQCRRRRQPRSFSPSPPLETVQEFLKETVRAVPEESIFGPVDEKKDGKI